MIIDLQNVSWRREQKLLLNNVNWTVRRGEHWALLGLNGSGKTTLLNMINGYLWPTEGKISVLANKFGEIDLRELRQSIGWVSSSLQEKLYASDKTQYIVISGKFATIGLYEKPTDEDYEFARDLMGLLGCGHLWDREYRTCSQGEKQKILIARALMAKPRLLILDEPCNGLDLFSREKLLSAIEDIAAQEDMPTLIYVTHHTEEILPVFNRALLLRRGEVFAQGETAAIMNSATLSAFFEADVLVDTHGQRAFVRLADHEG
ncbi:ABC transporter ATP-binding protein [Paenibacillus thalictri]|uniref:ABC transporter ATP-binding protein n=1 Tax=Paenibacillus thalictri TaxID=2527873 RepID=A0A4Q9DMA3_9BACL|nr:ABC transporter ATP-binding protein [Paenibacillus thalictri]